MPRRVRGRLEVVFHAGVEASHLAPALPLLADVRADLGASQLRPRAVERRVQVDPRQQAVPRFLVELHAVVPLAEPLHQPRLAGVELPRAEDGHVALLGGRADVAAELVVRGRELRSEIVPVLVVQRGHGRAVQQAGEGAAVAPRLAVVAAGAVAVEHGLDLVAEREAPRGSVEGRRLGRRLGGRQRRLHRRGGVLRLVAAGARDALARHGGHPAPHELDGRPVGVQRLEGHRRAGGDAEAGRPVRVDRNRAQHELGIPRPVQPDAVRLGAHALVGELVADDADGLDRAAGHAGQRGPGVDVGDGDLGVAAGGVDLVGDDRRARRGAKRERLEQGVALGLVDEHEVVERVCEVQAPGPIGGRLARDEEMAVAEREGVEELGPALGDGQVERSGQDGPPAGADELDGPLGAAAPAGRVEDHQVAHPRQLVVPADDGDDAGALRGQGAGEEHRRRPVRPAAVVLQLLRAVGVGVEEDAAERVRDVHVFPAEIEQPPVGQGRRAPVVVLLHGELADAPVAVAAVEVADVARAVDARHAGEAGGGAEDDRLVRHVAGVVVVHVRLADRLDLAQVLAVGADLVDLPPPAGRGHGEQQPLRVEVQVHVADESPIGGAVERGHLAARARGREEGDLVVVAGGLEAGIAEVVGGQAEIALASLDQQELGRQERIGQQGLVAQRREAGGKILGMSGRKAHGRPSVGIGGGELVHELVVFLLQCLQALEELGPARVSRAERRDQVSHSQVQAFPVAGGDGRFGRLSRRGGEIKPGLSIAQVRQQVGRERTVVVAGLGGRVVPQAPQPPGGQDDSSLAGRELRQRVARPAGRAGQDQRGLRPGRRGRLEVGIRGERRLGEPQHAGAHVRAAPGGVRLAHRRQAGLRPVVAEGDGLGRSRSQPQRREQVGGLPAQQQSAAGLHPLPEGVEHGLVAQRSAGLGFGPIAPDGREIRQPHGLAPLVGERPAGGGQDHPRLEPLPRQVARQLGLHVHSLAARIVEQHADARGRRRLKRRRGDGDGYENGQHANEDTHNLT
ncbi:MAG: hypothetical protein BWX88_04983 [Planctomycetes bacterium ADurb.Bin126]|nr:MAG: hypothetical protein BWX88_04983 [Planctomycetes bacterium ADurb.Bin126]